jgi:hypothetical protein
MAMLVYQRVKMDYNLLYLSGWWFLPSWKTLVSWEQNRVELNLAVAGWWYTYPAEKYDLVSWDDDIPNWMESHNPAMFQTTNQYNYRYIKFH